MSYGGGNQPQAFCGYASFVYQGKEAWATWDYDLRAKTLRSQYANNVVQDNNYNYQKYENKAASFEYSVATRNWSFWNGIEILLMSGTLPAGTEILMYARKYDPSKMPNIPKWGVVE
jgi:hypothetical protein